MGSDASCVFSDLPHPGSESAIFNAPAGKGYPLGKLVEKFNKYPEVRTYYDLMEHTKAISPHTPLFGRRVYQDGKWGDSFEWVDREEFCGWRDIVGSYINSVARGEEQNIGIMSYNKMEWVITQHACYAYSYVPVPIYDTFGWEAVKHIVNHAELKRIFIISTKAATILDHLDELPNLVELIIIDSEDNPFDFEKYKDVSIKLTKFNDILARNIVLPHRPPAPEFPASIMYTSGTTGNPKGCVLTHANIISAAASYTSLIYPFLPDESFLSYLPLAHIYECMIQACVISCLGRIGFYSGSLTRLMEELKILRPTAIIGVTRVYERIMDGIRKKINAQPKMAKVIFNCAFKAKSFLNRNFRIQHFWGLDSVFNSIRDAFGGRLRVMVCGGSAMPEESQHWLKIACRCSFIHGYGLTETTAAAAAQSHTDCLDGNVGTLMRGVEGKLRDVEEGGYFVKDGAGELLLRGPSIFAGYFKDTELTQAAFENGWFKTGDIFQFTSTNQLKVIARCKELVKLSQGEYVSIPKLTAVYSGLPHISQIYIHAGMTSRYLVAVAVLDTSDPESKNVTCESVLEAMNQKAESHKLNGFERVKAVHITKDQFTTENGMLTPSLKLCSHKIKAFYQKEIDDMLKAY